MDTLRCAATLAVVASIVLSGPLSADSTQIASFAYVANGDDDTISIYAVAPHDGRLRFNGYHACAPGEDGPRNVLVHPSGDFLFTTNLGSSNVSVYTIDAANGRLTAGTPVSTGAGPHSAALAASGDYLYVSAFATDEVYTYAIDGVTGALTQVGAAVPTDVGPDGIALDPLERWAYVIAETDLSVSIYDINSTTGELSASLPPVDVGPGMPGSVVVDSDGSHAYVTFENFGLLATYAIDQVTGDLSLLNTRTTGADPTAMTLRPGGGSLYVISEPNDTLVGFTLDGPTGNATRVPGNFATGSGPIDLAFDTSGLFFHVTNAGSLDVSTYSLNGLTGAPILSTEIRARNAPAGIALRAGPLVEEARFLYSLNAAAETISGFSVDTATGSLTDVGGAVVMTGSTPISTAADPLSRFLYTIDSNGLSTYSIDSVTGQLAAVGVPIVLAGQPRAVTVDPSGEYLYVALDAVDFIAFYAIDQVTGAPSLLGGSPVGADPQSVAVDPSGQFLYLTRATGQIEGFRIANGAQDGTLFSVGAPGNPQAVAFSPDGRFLFAPLKSIDVLLPFAIDAATGVPTIVPPGNNTGDQPAAFGAHPDGEFAVCAIIDPGGAGSVESYSVDPTTGVLTDVTSASAGSNPVDLLVSPSGRWVFTANRVSGDVSVLSLDGDSGTIASVSSAAAGADPRELALTSTFVTPSPPDCNNNATADHVDIAMGTSQDCNLNCIPDECEIDCNTNGIADECDIAFATSQDCNANLIPDECDIAGGTSIDCNVNGVPDDCDIDSGSSNDCNSNGVPDDCEPDCDSDGEPDDCEVFMDCNLNGISDECDIASGFSDDVDMNGIPDHCECRSANYCVGATHSGGMGARMETGGTFDLNLNNMSLRAVDCPGGVFGLFFFGPTQVQVAFGDGFRCVGGMTPRINPPAMTNAMGIATRLVDLNAPPFSANITPGSTWNFQFWFRDPMGPLGNGFNLTDGISVTFCP